MNSHKQWIRDPDHPTQWILNPNFRPSQVEPPSMQIQPIEEPIIQLPVELPHVELPQVEAPSMQIQPIHDPIIQLPVERPHVVLPQVAPPPPKLVQPIANPIPGLIVDSNGPSTPPALFHPGFLCLGPENCPHFSHQTQTPPRGPPSNNIMFLPVTLN